MWKPFTVLALATVALGCDSSSAGPAPKMTPWDAGEASAPIEASAADGDGSQPDAVAGRDAGTGSADAGVDAALGNVADAEGDVAPDASLDATLGNVADAEGGAAAEASLDAAAFDAASTDARTGPCGAGSLNYGPSPSPQWGDNFVQVAGSYAITCFLAVVGADGGTSNSWYKPLPWGNGCSSDTDCQGGSGGFCCEVVGAINLLPGPATTYCEPACNAPFEIADASVVQICQSNPECAFEFEAGTQCLPQTCYLGLAADGGHMYGQINACGAIFPDFCAAN